MSDDVAAGAVLANGNPSSLAVDRGTVYFTDNDSILSVPATGGPSRVVFEQRGTVYGVAVLGDELLWTGIESDANGSPSPLRLYARPLAADAAEAPRVISENVATNLERVGDRLFFFDGHGELWAYASGAAPQKLAPVIEPPRALLPDLVFHGSPQGLVRRDLATGESRLVWQGRQLRDAVADASEVFWFATAHCDAGTQEALWRLPSAGGEPSLVSIVRNIGVEMVLDAAAIYTTEIQVSGAPVFRRVLRIPRDGAPAQSLVSKLPGSVALALDGASLYVAAEGVRGGAPAGSILRVDLR